MSLLSMDRARAGVVVVPSNTCMAMECRYAESRLHRTRLRQRLRYILHSLDVLPIDEVHLGCKMLDRKTVVVAKEKQAVPWSSSSVAVSYLMMMAGCVTRRNDVGTRHRNEWHLNIKEWVKPRPWRATYICLHRKEHRWIHRMRSRHCLLVLMIGCRRLLRHPIHCCPRGSCRWCDRQIIGWIVGWWTWATVVALRLLLR